MSNLTENLRQWRDDRNTLTFKGFYSIIKL